MIYEAAILREGGAQAGVRRPAGSSRGGGGAADWLEGLAHARLSPALRQAGPDGDADVSVGRRDAGVPAAGVGGFVPDQGRAREADQARSVSGSGLRGVPVKEPASGGGGGGGHPAL